MRCISIVNVTKKVRQAMMESSLFLVAFKSCLVPCSVSAQSVVLLLRCVILRLCKTK